MSNLLPGGLHILTCICFTITYMLILNGKCWGVDKLRHINSNCQFYSRQNNENKWEPIRCYAHIQYVQHSWPSVSCGRPCAANKFTPNSKTLMAGFPLQSSRRTLTYKYPTHGNWLLHFLPLCSCWNLSQTDVSFWKITLYCNQKNIKISISISWDVRQILTG